jgi:hypothetical protein
LNDSVLGELGRSALGERGHYEIVTRDATPVYVTHPDAKQVLRSATTLASFDDFDTQRDFITRRSLRSAPWELRLVISGARGPWPFAAGALGAAVVAAVDGGGHGAGGERWPGLADAPARNPLALDARAAALARRVGADRHQRQRRTRAAGARVSTA